MVGELGESEGNKDADDVCIVAKVQVYVLIYGESDVVVVERCVDLGCGVCDYVVLHAG